MAAFRDLPDQYMNAFRAIMSSLTEMIKCNGSDCPNYRGISTYEFVTAWLKEFQGELEKTSLLTEEAKDEVRRYCS